MGYVNQLLFKLAFEWGAGHTYFYYLIVFY